MPKEKAKASEAAEPAVTSSPYASTADIKLGQVARDPSTGLVGQLDCKTDLLSGTTQYLMQPQGDGKSVPDRFYVDDFLLEYVSEGVSARVPAVDPDDKFALGQRLADNVTGYAGIATQRNTHLNGCVHYHLQQSMADQKGKKLLEDLPQGATFDYKRLKLVNDGVAQKKDDGALDKTPKSKTGGPTIKGPSRAVAR